MVTETHKVGERKCIIYKQDTGKWLQILFLPSAWENKYYVITEELEEKIHSCTFWTKEKIIKIFGNSIIDELNKNL